MAVSSLPSPYGIGTLGKAAYDFVDFLKAAGQSYWQMLPLNPTSYGDSPYQSFSAYAGNPYFIDLDYLAEEGLREVDQITWEKVGLRIRECYNQLASRGWFDNGEYLQAVKHIR